MSNNNGFGTIKLIFGVLVAGIAAMFLLQERKPIEPPKDEWFQNAVVSEKRPVMVKFGADWCGPCRQLDQTIRDIAPQIGSRVKLVFVNINKQPELAAHYGVHGIPHSFVFYRGQVVSDMVGSMDAGTFRNWIDDSIRSIKHDEKPIDNSLAHSR